MDQLDPSLGNKSPVKSNIKSTNHHTPKPPIVSSFPTAVPECPKQNLSTPKQPRKNEYNRVLTNEYPVYLK